MGRDRRRAVEPGVVGEDRQPLSLPNSYILLDGGIADNLALRGVVNGGIALDETSGTFRRVALKARRVLVLSVDGQSAPDPTLSKQRVVTGLSQICGAVSGTRSTPTISKL